MRYFFVLCIAIIVLISPDYAAAEIQIIAEPGVTPTIVTDVQQTVKMFTIVVKDTLNTSFDGDIKIYICPNREVFIQVMERELNTKLNFNRISPEAYVASSPRTRTLFLNVSTGDLIEPYERSERLAAQLFWQLAFHLRGQKYPNEARVETQGEIDALYWMDQGMMDYVGAKVAERIGLRNIEKWKEERIQYLRRFYSLKPISYKEVALLSVRSWAEILVPNSVYKADLLVAYLFQQRLKKGLTAVPNYYRQSENTDNVQIIWEQAFGLKYERFVSDFVNWYNNTLLGKHAELGGVL